MFHWCFSDVVSDVASDVASGVANDVFCGNSTVANDVFLTDVVTDVATVVLN